MSCQQLGDECKLCIFCAPGSEVLFQICLSLSSPPPYSVKCWQKWKGLGKVIYTLIHWTAMLLYQLQIYKVQVTYSSQIVGIVYPIRIYISKNVHSPTLCPKGTQKPSTEVLNGGSGGGYPKSGPKLIFMVLVHLNVHQ